MTYIFVCKIYRFKIHRLKSLQNRQLKNHFYVMMFRFCLPGSHLKCRFVTPKGSTIMKKIIMPPIPAGVFSSSLTFYNDNLQLNFYSGHSHMNRIAALSIRLIIEKKLKKEVKSGGPTSHNRNYTATAEQIILQNAAFHKRMATSDLPYHPYIIID